MSIARFVISACIALLSTAPAFAQLYTTLPADPAGGPCFGAENLAAVEVQTPAGQTHRVDSATVRMHHAADAAASFALAIYTNNAGVPGTLVGNIGAAPGNGIGTQDLYTLTVAAPVALSPSTSYWIVATSTSSDGCAFGWTFPGSAPTGAFTHVAETQFFGGLWGNRTGQHFALQLDEVAAATVVPAPVPTLSDWSLILLSIVLAAGTVAAVRRRPQPRHRASIS